MTARTAQISLISVLLFGMGFPAEGEMRTWTSITGAAVEAEFVEQQLDNVVLRTGEGDLLEIRLNQLSRDDQIYVGSQRTATVGRPQRQASGNAVPPEIRRVFGNRLVNAEGQRISAAELQGKKIGLFFSAQWCPPCRAFTPRLVEAYEELKAQGKPFEVVFVSHDRTEDDMYGYMRDYKMPWLAIRYDDRRRTELRSEHNIAGIPSLIIVDDTGNVLSANGRAEVSSRGADAFDHW